MSERANPPTLANLSIQRKLTLIIMTATTVALLLISSAFVAYELFTFRQTMTSDISGLAEIMGNQSTAALTYDDRNTAEEILRSLSARQRIVAAGLYKNGKLFAQYPKNAPDGALPVSPSAGPPKFDGDYLILSHPIRLNGETIGTIYLKSDLQDLDDRLWRYAGIILLFMLASWVVAFFLSARLQKIISLPISHLVETAKAISTEKNYSVRAVKRSEDELGQLTDGFNEMLTQIQERDAALMQAHDRLEKRVEERTPDLQSEIVERERAQEALKKQLERISLLNHITQVISERQDLPSILEAVLQDLEERAPVDMGSFLLLEPGSERLTVAAIREKHLRFSKVGFQAGATLSLEESGLVFCSGGETMYIEDSRKAGPKLAQTLARAELNCAVAAPMMVEGRFFGVLLVARREAESFTSAEGEFFRGLSEHVALAAHQSRLHTELETAYNDLRQTQQAVMQQDRLRALGQMASGIAHDINNALSPVVGFAGLLMSYEPNLSPTAKKHLNYIKTAGEDVAHIVARLKEFYRHRGDQEPLVMINLNQVVEQVIEMTRPRWRDIPQEKGVAVEMSTSLSADLPELPGIASEIREALTNLILNAVDALSNGGKLTVQTRVVRGPGDGLTHGVIEVTDTGVGMSEKTRKHCLEPFFSTKGKRGTGMGLAMVYGVMERHEGKIEIESELGKGTTMRLIFPLHARVSSADGHKLEAGPAGTLRILCIDDEPLLRELIKDMLEHEGHWVQTADGGETGLDAFDMAVDRGRPFDIVITDLGMPHLDGREVARALKKTSPRTPVIMLTGWGAFMKGDGDMPVYVDGVLSKPPRVKELNAMLGRLSRAVVAQVPV